eukprot:snap_masked-scaffold_45-processed-gene-0.39-mRNA-1 protein AED:1.00 eAED:1.00 QI:0/0/0/0/1/1/2/0/82
MCIYCYIRINENTFTSNGALHVLDEISRMTTLSSITIEQQGLVVESERLARLTKLCLRDLPSLVQYMFIFVVFKPLVCASTW